jgi:ribosome-binding factor A
MPREFGRNVRIAEEMRRVLAPVLTDIARDVGAGMVTITDVEVARDLSVARIFVSVLGAGAPRSVLEELRAHLPQMRARVAQALRMKKTPALVMDLDESATRGARISELLKSKPPPS